MAEIIASPNYASGRGGKAVDRLVIHWMAGTLAATDAEFRKIGGNSAHYGIENGTVHQYVGEENTAYHSGNFTMNQRSIGIEHSAAPGRDASTATVDTSVALVANICLRYGIPCDRQHILKHSEVISTQCPGTIPIDDIVSRANKLIQGGNMNPTAQDIKQLGGEFWGMTVDDNTANSLAKGTWPEAMYYLADAWPWRTRKAQLADLADQNTKLAAENARLQEELKKQPVDASDAELRLKAIQQALGIK